MKHKIITLAFLGLFLTLTNISFAQYSEDTPDRHKKKSAPSDDENEDDSKNKIIYGLQVGIPMFYIPPIDFSVQVGYKPHAKVELGGQLNLISTPIATGSRFYGFYGPGAFARLFFTDMIFATTEFSYMNMPSTPVSNIANPVVTRSWNPLGLVGFGYKKGMMSENSYTYGTILYQVMPSLQSDVSPYFYPLIIKTGIVF